MRRTDTTFWSALNALVVVVFISFSALAASAAPSDPSKDEIAADFDALSPVKVTLAFHCRRRFTRLRFDAVVLGYDGIPVFSTTSQDYDSIAGDFAAGDYCVQRDIPST